MEIWITRDQRGIFPEEYTSPDEIEESLKELEVYREFDPKEEVKMEFTAPWEEIKSFLHDLQRLADLVRDMDYVRDSEPDKLIRRMKQRKLIKV